MLDEPTVKVNTRALLTQLAPALAQGRLTEAELIIQSHWTIPQLLILIDKQTACCSDARKVATAALGLVGDKTAIAPLAVALHDEDGMIVQMAEHALWNIWFRLGKPAANCQLKKGCCHLNHGNFDQAVEHFTAALKEDPTFAEAYHQRAIAHYLADHYSESIADCRTALELIPQHFGAMTGMGNAYAHLKDWSQARYCYRLALAIHPQLESVPMALHQIEEILANDPPPHAPPPTPTPPPAATDNGTTC